MTIVSRTFAVSCFLRQGDVSVKRKKGRRERSRTGPRIQRLGGTGVVFCDEAGFTGNNLLDRAQEVFVYAGVAIEAGRAREIVERITRDFRIQSAELQGSRLLKSQRGRRAVT